MLIFIDILVTQGAKTSMDVALTLFPKNILTSAPKGFTQIKSDTSISCSNGIDISWMTKMTYQGSSVIKLLHQYLPASTKLLPEPVLIFYVMWHSPLWNCTVSAPKLPFFIKSLTIMSLKLLPHLQRVNDLIALNINHKIIHYTANSKYIHSFSNFVSKLITVA